MLKILFNNMFWNWYEYDRRTTGCGYTVISYCNKKTGETKQVIG